MKLVPVWKGICQTYHSFCLIHYYKPSDEFNSSWDLAGMVEDLELLFQVDFRLGNEDTFPNWKENAEFKARRDMDMEAARTNHSLWDSLR